ncbi:TIGR03862 family flavoprotein [Collimonas fungivorans]|uniref:NAD(FAD)-utilizing dehydrogenase n=1 Tax=Collimonas fungivorans (strain Ter331) TaxID=1005048 RepID=G0A8P5_COLFT|nr:TIGR03862 family flavoprotein [Collimonas fungivorans]AEK61518.1 NAD(FAD)-utilizing dehydrogenase [Collimonas fungivorans Ter331]
MTSLNNSGLQKTVAVIGGGPAGLMAAEVLAAGGMQVHVYDAMPSVGRKFLLAGKGGMNLTHSEAYDDFLSRYGARRPQIVPLLDQFNPDALRAWVHALGIDTFIGSSGRVFPTDMKAAPLLRAWLHRLRQAGVGFHMRHRWLGWNEAGALSFETPQGELAVDADSVVLALGGGSWARLGSDAKWVPLLARREVPVAPLLPANCGFEAAWSDYFREHFAGHHLKSVAIAISENDRPALRKQGEFVITADGVEGSLIYALSAGLRDRIAASGSALIHLDLLPDWSLQRVTDEVARPRGARSWSSHLQSRLGLKGVKTSLLRELVPAADFGQPLLLAQAIKALPLTLLAARPIDEAISSAGGVRFEGMDQGLMLKALPGVFCAGEMLDWEAPTGGYLLSVCLASGRAAGNGVLSWLR